MEKRDRLIRVYIGTEITCLALIGELESAGVKAVLKNDFQYSINAGYVMNTPSSIEVFITDSELEQARPIIEEFIKNNPV